MESYLSAALTSLIRKTNLVSKLLAGLTKLYSRLCLTVVLYWCVYGKVTVCVCVLRERVKAGSNLAVLGVLQLSRCIAGISERAIKTEGRVRGEVACSPSRPLPPHTSVTGDVRNYFRKPASEWI